MIAPARALACAALVPGFVAAQAPSETFSLLHPARSKTFIKASSDPDERPTAPMLGNDDGFSGINQVEAYRERVGLDEIAVLADVQGRAGYMGVFFRNFWTGLVGAPVASQEMNRTQILLDGAVRHDLLLPDYFRNVHDPRGQVAPFRGPFTANRAGGHLTHTPLTWQDSFKVQVFDNAFENAGRFHKVAGSLASPEKLLRVPDLAGWERVYARIGGWRHDAPRAATTHSLQLTRFDSGRVGTIDLEGPATILELRCRIDDPSRWNDLVARFTWDHRSQPSVEVPLRLLGGMMRRPFSHALDTLLFGNDGDRELWCYFPMHFTEAARLEFVNRSGANVRLDVTIATQDGLHDAPWGYFSAFWNQAVTTPGVSFRGPKLTGTRGMLRAILLEDCLDNSGRIPALMDLMHLEGDLCIRINGNRGDEHNFAATETSIGKWGWYLSPSDVPFASDTSFNTGIKLVQSANGFVAIDRLQGSTYVFDPVHFVDGIDIVLEHGIQNLSNADYGLFTVFYLQDGPARERVMTLDVGDPAAEATANVLFGTAPLGTVSSTFFRDQFYGTPPLTDEVRDVKDWYRFTVRGPRLDRYKGVCVGFRLERWRLGDGGVCQARLFVNGVYAGLLHSHSSNALNRWKEGGELEVELPRALTDGRSSFVVEVRHVAGTEPLVVGQIDVYGYTRD